jgi:hypothetical protein
VPNFQGVPAVFARITMRRLRYMNTSRSTTTGELASLLLITESALLPNIEVGVPKVSRLKLL